MCSTTKYLSLFGTVVRVPLVYFVLFSDVAATFPCHSNLFLPKIYNFPLVLSNKVPLNLITSFYYLVRLKLRF